MRAHRCSFRAYAPLLSQIKAAYDDAIDTRMQKLFEVQPKVVKLDALRNGYDLNLRAVYDKHEEVRDDVDVHVLRRCVLGRTVHVQM